MVLYQGLQTFFFFQQHKHVLMYLDLKTPKFTSFAFQVEED